MRLIRMKLENWRGISERAIAFEDGVTILEGPNEIGKSSIVEALRILIHDFASSTKAAIKEVQPVGQDIGSSVEAEIESGHFHFTYRKTFNKGKTTELNILAPVNKQLTGREAHDRVLEMLDETVDLDLWKALLVDQGAPIERVDLKESKGLSDALDAAAAGTSASGEDVALLEAARHEYELYFTPRSGKDRLTELASALEQAESAVVRATDALNEVEADANRLQSLDADIRRRLSELPALQDNLEKHRKNKQATDTLKSELQIATTRLDAGEERKQSVAAASAARRKLIEEITKGEKSLAKESEALAPLQEREQTLKAELKQVSLEVGNLAKSTRLKKAALKVARDDQIHIENTATLAEYIKLVDNVESIEKKLKSAQEEIASIAIDDNGLEKLRNAESDQRVIKGRRDHAATNVAITAEKNFELLIDNESTEISSGETREHAVTSDTEFRLQGIAEIRVTPPKSVVDLDQELREAQVSFNQALARYGVGSLDEARAALARKQSAQQEARQHEDRMSNLLGDESVQSVRLAVMKLQKECDNYLSARKAGLPVPEDTATARRLHDTARQTLEEEERELEAAQSRERDLRTAHEKADELWRNAQNNQSSFQATLDERGRQLKIARSELNDEDLANQLESATRSVTGLATDVERLTSELKQLSPDTIDDLFDNADAALQRAKADMADIEQQQAVFKDRLTRAKADGRFETCEDAERNRDSLKEDLDAKRTRAAAARRLWETLNRHRDAARQAYVQPLKDAIERLGRIVFGADFEVAVNDDWTLSTRTLNGITLPWESLSVGAKEQLGILTRLAAAQIVSDHGGVPLIIDDALGFSDPGRLETMGAAIAAAGKSCQVIILTCAPGRFTHVGNASVVRFQS